MIGNDDVADRKKLGQLADLPRVLEQSRAMIETSRDLLERSQRHLLSPAHVQRNRQIVQKHIYDQAILKKLRKDQ